MVEEIISAVTSGGRTMSEAPHQTELVSGVSHDPAEAVKILDYAFGPKGAQAAVIYAGPDGRPWSLPVCLGYEADRLNGRLWFMQDDQVLQEAPFTTPVSKITARRYWHGLGCAVLEWDDNDGTHLLTIVRR